MNVTTNPKPNPKPNLNPIPNPNLKINPNSTFKSDDINNGRSWFLDARLSDVHNCITVLIFNVTLRYISGCL